MNNLPNILFTLSIACFLISIIFSAISCYLTSNMCKYRGYRRRKYAKTKDKKRKI